MKTLLRNLVSRSPRLKGLLQRGLRFMLPGRGVSNHYVEMAGEEVGRESVRLRSAWKDDGLPVRQRELVDQQLAAYRRGDAVDVFDVMVKCLQGLRDGVGKMRVLEVGCSSGYYSEVFEIAGLDLDYSGCDYSDAFIAMARQRYPREHFDVQDATLLGYADKTFDVVISGCCLLHIPEYEAAVAETARVAGRYAVFHRTPVVLGQPSKHYRKQAYGVETVETHFNEPQFLQLLADNGLQLQATLTLDESVVHGLGSATRTYVCRKNSP
ncbi:MAG: methylase [Burkholderiales bacterium PBB3]|nr:MAG: methylase [Burkholderiales bacterium PBB3]